MIRLKLQLDKENRFPMDGLRDILRLFFGVAKFEQISETEASYAVHEEYKFILGTYGQLVFCLEHDKILKSNTSLSIYIDSHKDELLKSGELILLSVDDSSKTISRKIKRSFYNALSKLTNKRFPWGALTGIRPTYVFNEMLREGKSKAEAILLLEDEYRVKPGKARLAAEVAEAEQAILAAQTKDSVELYIHVPFCMTRCSYCSFTAREAINPSSDSLAKYHQALISEIEQCLSFLTMNVNTIFIGGGTPSIFTSKQLEELLGTLAAHLPLADIKELSFEAGRSDSIDEEKLAILHANHVSRLCINPQSMQDETLKRIGRPTKVEDIIQVFNIARRIGFDHINMDLIAGLNGETEQDFIDSLRQVMELKPESITIHSLARKYKSDLDGLISDKIKLDDKSRREDALRLHAALGQEDATVEAMLNFAEKSLKQSAYKPYYLYRQKDGLGGLENVAYAKEAYACIYNVCMMTDARSVIAFGAGAISKRLVANKTRRSPNLFSINEYISRLNEMVERKIQFFSD